MTPTLGHQDDEALVAFAELAQFVVGGGLVRFTARFGSGLVDPTSNVDMNTAGRINCGISLDVSEILVLAHAIWRPWPGVFAPHSSGQGPLRRVVACPQ
jgi:hypothetical protein